MKCLEKKEEIFKRDKWLRGLMETDGQQLEGKLSGSSRADRSGWRGAVMEPGNGRLRRAE